MCSLESQRTLEEEGGSEERYKDKGQRGEAATLLALKMEEGPRAKERWPVKLKKGRKEPEIHFEILTLELHDNASVLH